MWSLIRSSRRFWRASTTSPARSTSCTNSGSARRSTAGSTSARRSPARSATSDLDDHVAVILAEHIRESPPVTIELPGHHCRHTRPGNRSSAARSPCCSPTRPAGRSPTSAGQRCRRSGAPPPGGPTRGPSTPCGTTYHDPDHPGCRPDRGAKGVAPLEPADHVRDVRALVAQDGTPPEYRQHGLESGRRPAAQAARSARIALICAGFVRRPWPECFRWSGLMMVETRGLEPLTPALQRRCSAN